MSHAFDVRCLYIESILAYKYFGYGHQQKHSPSGLGRDMANPICSMAKHAATPTWALNVRGISDIGTQSAAHAVAKLPIWSSFSASSRVGCAPIAPGLVVVTAPQAAANSTHLRSLSASPRTASRPPACKRTREESKICMLCRLPLRLCCASLMLLPKVLCQYSARWFYCKRL